MAYTADHGQLCNSFPDIYKPLFQNKMLSLSHQARFVSAFKQA